MMESTRKNDFKLKFSPSRSRCNANLKGLKRARVCALANGQASSAQKESNAVESSKGTKQETLAAARGKQTGVGAKAAKKKETKAYEDERGDPREARRRYETRREGEARREWKTTPRRWRVFLVPSRAWQPHFG